MHKLTIVAAAVLVLTSFSNAQAESPKGLVAAYAKQAGISEKDAALNFNWMIAALKDELKESRSITVQNFGKFYVEERDARVVRNPKTGEKLQIGARKYARFTLSDSFKRELNPNEAVKEVAVTELPVTDAGVATVKASL